MAKAWTGDAHAVDECPFDVSEDDVAKIELSSAPEPIKAVARDRWPRHAENLAKFAIANDAGLGSTCKRLIEAADNPDALLAVEEFLRCEYGIKLVLRQAGKWLLKILIGDKEQDCTGCSLRRAESDARYPRPKDGWRP